MGVLSGAMIGVAPRLIARALNSVVPNTENALVEVSLSPFGFLQTTEGGGGGVVTTRLPEWWGQPFVSSYGVAHGLQAQCRLMAGSAPNAGSNPIGVWNDMSLAPVFWRLFQNAVGTLTGTWEISIRSAGTGTVLALANYTVTATKNP